MNPKESSQQHAAASWLTERPRAVFVLLAIEILAIDLLKLPDSMAFEHYAFCDAGANLTLQYVTAHGLRPAIDFGYNYGLLPILAGRIWFGIAGATPISLQALMTVCDLAIAWAIAKIVSRIRFGAAGLALTAITLGFAVQASYPSIAQAVEAVLLASALASQARGSRASALALACAAVFAKPSMGYVYSLVLIAAIVRERWRAGAKPGEWVAELAPAAATGAALVLVLGIIYGPLALARTAIPIEGMSNYRAGNFGFFTGAGREFWDPHGLSWLFYLIDFSGFWIAGTIFLIGSGVAAIFYLATGVGGGLEARRNEIVATCAVLHVAFITLFFGNQWSWIYYAYFLTVGVAAAAGASAIQRRVTIGLGVMGMMAWTHVIRLERLCWDTGQRDAVTAGLWASPDERKEWGQVLDTIRGSKAVVLDLKGAAELMYPEFEPPVTLYLDPGLIKPLEIQRKLAQLSAAQLVVVPANIGIEVCNGIPAVPELEAAIKGFEPRVKGKHFDVYQRRKE